MSLTKNLHIKYGAVVGAIIFLILGLGLYFRNAIGAAGGAEEFPISWFIIVSAITGAAVNQPFRKEEPQQMSLFWILGYILWKSSVAVVFAFILYLMMIAGLISGDIFPQFTKTTIENGGQYVNMKKFATIVDPESYKDVAKILVWSFIAGYSEKFVPNLLSQIMSATASEGNE